MVATRTRRDGTRPGGRGRGRGRADAVWRGAPGRLRRGRAAKRGGAGAAAAVVATCTRALSGGRSGRGRAAGHA